MATIDALPLPALQLVLRLTLPSFNDDPAARNTSVSAPTLQLLATVNRSWYAAMSAVLDAHRRSTRTFALERFDVEHYMEQANRASHNNSTAIESDRSSRTSCFSRHRSTKASEARSPSPPSSRIARSVSRFFASIVHKAHTSNAFPWEADDTELAISSTVPHSDRTSNQNDAASAPTETIHETLEQAMERHMLGQIQRMQTHLQATASTSTDNSNIHTVRHLVELRLCNDDTNLDPNSSSNNNNNSVAASTQLTDALQHAWNDVFRCCPSLQRLDLARVSLVSLHLPAVLLAASTHCRALQTLVLPQHECLGYHRRNVQPVFDALYTALANWRAAPPPSAAALTQTSSRQHHHEPPSGLRRLVMPKLFAYEFYDDHMATIAATCPTLEYVDGLRLAPIFQARGLSHDQVLHSWLEAWTAFCVHCTHLREWNWFDVPFVDAFFYVFAAAQSPNERLRSRALRSLVLPGNTTLWKRDYVYAAHHDVPADPSCRCSFDGLRAMLRACPALTTLDVRFSDRHLLFGTDDATMLISDAFLYEVVRSCPCLETLRLVEAEPRHGVEATNAITATGIAALATLPRLAVVELSGVALSGPALFAVATQRYVDDHDRVRRRIRATVGVRGICKSAIAATYNDIVTTLLAQLLDATRSNDSTSTSTPLPRFVVELRIDTANHQLPAQWSAPFRHEWMALKHTLAGLRTATDASRGARTSKEHCGACVRVTFDLIHAITIITCGS